MDSHAGPVGCADVHFRVVTISFCVATAGRAYFPASQCVQVDDAGAEYFPGSQTWQSADDVDPSTVENFPVFEELNLITQ